MHRGPAAVRAARAETAGALPGRLPRIRLGRQPREAGSQRAPRGTLRFPRLPCPCPCPRHTQQPRVTSHGCARKVTRGSPCMNGEGDTSVVSGHEHTDIYSFPLNLQAFTLLFPSRITRPNRKGDPLPSPPSQWEETTAAESTTWFKLPLQPKGSDPTPAQPAPSRFPDGTGRRAPSPAAGAPQGASPPPAGLQLPAPSRAHPAPCGRWGSGYPTLGALAQPGGRMPIRREPPPPSPSSGLSRTLSPVQSEGPAVGVLRKPGRCPHCSGVTTERLFSHPAAGRSPEGRCKPYPARH